MNNSNQEQILENFRAEWKQEVQQKHNNENQPSSSIDNNHKNVTNEGQEESVSNLIDQTESLVMTDSPAAPVTALDHYIIAVDNERQGKLGKALDSYRIAFKLDPDIDRVYKKYFEETILPDIEKNKDKHLADAPLFNGSKPAEEKFEHFIPLGVEYTAPLSTEKDPLEDLSIQFLKQDNTYIPRLDYKPVYISKLPNEIMLRILRILFLYSISSMPYFATVCKKFFLLSRDTNVWQYTCTRIFRTPSMTLEESKRFQANYVEKNYSGNWMRMFIDRPRIRYDGIYISTCNYIRQGESETGWSNPIHLVTYYRYIRFFPNGIILKHLTSEEPDKVVRLLKPGYNRKQCFHGHFVYEEAGKNTVAITMQDETIRKNEFKLVLKINTTHRGRHNKLNWERYSCRSNTLQNNSGGREERSHDFDLKSFRPFFFSPVRSYKVNYDLIETEEIVQSPWKQ